MTPQEFAIGMDQLKSLYGEKTYGVIRDKAIFSWAKNLKKELWLEIINHAISSCERAPLLPKLQEIWLEVKGKYKQENILNACLYCGGHGLYIDPDSGVPGIAYACRCDVGMGMHSSIPKWQGLLIRINPTKAELEWRDVKKLVNQTMEAK